jgi:hypothetical protein
VSGPDAGESWDDDALTGADHAFGTAPFGDAGGEELFGAKAFGVEGAGCGLAALAPVFGIGIAAFDTCAGIAAFDTWRTWPTCMGIAAFDACRTCTGAGGGIEVAGGMGGIEAVGAIGATLGRASAIVSPLPTNPIEAGIGRGIETAGLAASARPASARTASARPASARTASARTASARPPSAMTTRTASPAFP